MEIICIIDKVCAATLTAEKLFKAGRPTSGTRNTRGSFKKTNRFLRSYPEDSSSEVRGRAYKSLFLKSSLGDVSIRPPRL